MGTYWILSRAVSNMLTPIDIANPFGTGLAEWGAAEVDQLAAMELSFTEKSAGAYRLGVIAFSKNVGGAANKFNPGGNTPPSAVAGTPVWVPAFLGRDSKGAAVSFQDSTTLGAGPSGADLVDSVAVSCLCTTIVSPTPTTVYKIGEALQIEWNTACYCKLGRVEIFIYKGDTLIDTVSGSEAPSGSVLWPIMRTALSGTDYRVRIVGHYVSTVASKGASVVAMQGRVPMHPRPVESAAILESNADNAPEVWSAAFEIQKAPRRAVSAGASRDTVFVVGLDNITLDAFRAGEKHFREAFLELARPVDSDVDVDIVEVTKCPCLAEHASATIADASFAAPTVTDQASIYPGRRLDSSSEIGKATPHYFGKLTGFLSTDGHVIDFSGVTGFKDLNLDKLVSDDHIFLRLSNITSGVYTVAYATDELVVVWESIAVLVDTLNAEGVVVVPGADSRADPGFVTLYKVDKAEVASKYQMAGLQIGLRLKTQGFLDRRFSKRDDLRKCTEAYTALMSKLKQQGGSRYDHLAKYGSEYYNCTAEKALVDLMQEQVRGTSLMERVVELDSSFALSKMSMSVKPVVDKMPSTILVHDAEARVCEAILMGQVRNREGARERERGAEREREREKEIDR